MKNSNDTTWNRTSDLPDIVTNVYGKVKVKFTLKQARKAQRRSRGIVLLFL